MASAIKMITLGVTEKMIVISGELVFMALLVWGQLVVMVVMADCTWVAVVRFVSILISPFVLLLVECVGEGLGLLSW